jgi:flagellar motor protein MotB
MNFTFTQKEFQRLLELTHLGMWVVTAYQGEETAAAKRYFELDQKILALAASLGNADLAETRPDGTLQPSPKLAEDERIRGIQGDFSNDVFWHELVARLADRDYSTEQAKRALTETPGVEPPPTPEERIKQLEDVLWAEFEKNDLANVLVLRGGGRG